MKIKDDTVMGGYSSDRWNERRWHEHRHHGNFWVFGLIFLGLIVLTHGWILFLPLMAFAAFACFAFFAFVLPRLAWHMHEGNWQDRDWSQWAAWRDEKRKRHFEGWNDWNNDEKPKRKSDDIEYV